MVQDNVTGLVWENKMDDDSIHDKDNTYNWNDAQSVFIATLNSQNFGGHSDWRLPTAKELSFLVDRDRYDPSINTTNFPNTESSYYWSSTTNANAPDIAWIVNTAMAASTAAISRAAAAACGRCAGGSVGHLVITSTMVMEP